MTFFFAPVACSSNRFEVPQRHVLQRHPGRVELAPQLGQPFRRPEDGRAALGIRLDVIEHARPVWVRPVAHPAQPHDGGGQVVDGMESGIELVFRRKNACVRQGLRPVLCPDFLDALVPLLERALRHCHARRNPPPAATVNPPRLSVLPESVPVHPAILRGVPRPPPVAPAAAPVASGVKPVDPRHVPVAPPSGKVVTPSVPA